MSLKQIRYSYSVNEEGELVHIKSLTDATRHVHRLYCLQCGQEMVAKLGTKKVWHFSHKAEIACDGETYLHKLAKRMIREKFVSANHFPITFSKEVTCLESNRCPCFIEETCQEHDVKISCDLKIWNNSIVYDTCEEETSVGSFRPDLLLTCSIKPNRRPVFIEIFKTHQSESEKLFSNYKIIETKKIESEEDIEDIVLRGFVEGENCTTYNFNPPLPFIRKTDVPIDRFVLFKSGAVKVFKASNYVVYCNNVYKRYHPRSVVELNMRDQGIDLWGDNEQTNVLDSYQTGLVYLVKKGMTIRNCILCKYYKYNDFYSSYICILYKTIGIDSRPNQSFANKCQRYELNPRLMTHSLSELEKVVFEIEYRDS